MEKKIKIPSSSIFIITPMESLFLNKLFENAILCGHQCIECAQLGHCALVQHHNLVGVFDGGQAVGNDEHGVAAFCQQSVQRFSDLENFFAFKKSKLFYLIFAGCIQCTCCLVQNQNSWLLKICIFSFYISNLTLINARAIAILCRCPPLSIEAPCSPTIVSNPFGKAWMNSWQLESSAASWSWQFNIIIFNNYFKNNLIIADLPALLDPIEDVLLDGGRKKGRRRTK